jgi:hypothetical protein
LHVRFNKRLDRFTRRGRTSVHGQWLLCCLVYRIETLTRAASGERRTGGLERAPELPLAFARFERAALQEGALLEGVGRRHLLVEDRVINTPRHHMNG